MKSIGNEAGVFPVLKEGKAVLKNLVMNVDQLTPSAGGGKTQSPLPYAQLELI